jgi:N-acetylneuraminic acid mutarotase
MPSPRTLLAAAALPDPWGRPVLYAIGGLRTDRTISAGVQAYDVEANSWSIRPCLPQPLYGTNGAVACGGRIWLSGGVGSLRHGYSRRLLVFDPGQNAWSRRRDLPAAGYGGVTGVIGDALYVLTSCGDDSVGASAACAAFYRYEPAADRWTELRPPASPHQFGAGAVLAGELVVAGGLGTHGETDEVEGYDPVADRWTRRAPMPQPRSEMAAVVLGGRLVVAGGIEEAPGRPGEAGATTLDYHPSSDRWSVAAPLASPRASVAAVRVAVGGEPRMHLLGGERPNHLRFQL